MSRPAWIATAVTFVVVALIAVIALSFVFDGALAVAPALVIAGASAFAVYLAQKDKTPRSPR